MPKPLQVTFWGRCKLLLRGLLFYNTVYWRRASDGLNPPRLSPEERKILAPALNLDVVKPRERPRGHLDEVERQRMLDELARLRIKLPPSVKAAMAAHRQNERVAVGPAAPVPPVKLTVGKPPPIEKLRRSPPPVGASVKRRRKRRVRRLSEDEVTSGGFVARLLGRWVS